MAGHTPNYGMNYFGPGVGGAITDEGGKFALGDRLQLDRMLKAIEGHRHEGGVELLDPTGTPAVSLDTIGGQLPGGLDVYYRISYVDQHGLETAASPEAVVATPAPLLLPPFPTLGAAALDDAAPGSGLGAGTYIYGLTAIAGEQETPLGITASITLDGTLPTVVVTFPDPQDTQTQWGVWRKAPRDVGYTKIDVLDVSELSTIDDGFTDANPDATDPSQAPPTTNATASSNSITIEVPDPDLVGVDPIGQIYAWRLYRTYTSASYGPASLLAEINTTVNEDGTGGLVLTFTDDGSLPLQDGAPLDVSQTFAPPPPVALPTDIALPTVLTDWPEGSAFVLDNGDGTHTLYGLYGGVWEALGGTGGGGGAVGVGHYATWEHNAAGAIDYAADLTDSSGTSITVDSSTAWTSVWGTPAPVLVAGTYLLAFSGTDSGAWWARLGLFDATGSALPGTSDKFRTIGTDISGSGNFEGTVEATIYVPAGTHFDLAGTIFAGAAPSCTLFIQKVG